MTHAIEKLFRKGGYKKNERKGDLEKITFEEYTLDWSQSKVFLVLLAFMCVTIIILTRKVQGFFYYMCEAFITCVNAIIGEKTTAKLNTKKNLINRVSNGHVNVHVRQQTVGRHPMHIFLCSRLFLFLFNFSHFSSVVRLIHAQTKFVSAIYNIYD